MKVSANRPYSIMIKNDGELLALHIDVPFFQVEQGGGGRVPLDVMVRVTEKKILFELHQFCSYLLHVSLCCSGLTDLSDGIWCSSVYHHTQTQSLMCHLFTFQPNLKLEHTEIIIRTANNP